MIHLLNRTEDGSSHACKPWVFLKIDNPTHWDCATVRAYLLIPREQRCAECDAVAHDVNVETGRLRHNSPFLTVWLAEAERRGRPL